MSHDTDLEGLEPNASDQRSMGLSHYIPLWWSSVITVQSLTIAFFAIYPQGNLNLMQVIVASFIGSSVLAGFFILNGFPGYKDGIPFAAQTRAAFGIRGANIPNYLRISPAIAWLGIGNWIGALAIDAITTTLWGFGNVWIYFVLFSVLNLSLAWGGIGSIKWFNAIAASVIAVLLAYTAYITLTTQSIPTKVITYQGSWSWGFLGFISVIVGQLITGALNASDLTRHLENKAGSRNQIVGNLLGLVPSYLFMLLIGLLFAISTGISDPIEAIIAVAPSPLIGAAMLLFVVLAQISTNLTVNLLPPAHVFQDSIGVSWEQGVLLTTVLSFGTFPWLLFTSDLFYTFIKFYAAFLGPILGILLADYWIIRQGDIDMDSLYDGSKRSKFWFVRGFSISALVSLILGVLASLPVLNLSWLVGLPVGFVSYVVFTKITLNRRIVTYLSSEGRPVSEAD